MFSFFRALWATLGLWVSSTGVCGGRGLSFPGVRVRSWSKWEFCVQRIQASMGEFGYQGRLSVEKNAPDRCLERDEGLRAASRGW